MDTSMVALIIGIAVLALVLIAVLLAARRRGSWMNEQRRASAANSRDEAADIDRAARTHDAEADELAARAQRDRVDAQEREERARRLREQAHEEGADAADEARRADRLDPDVDHKAHTTNDRSADAGNRRRDSDGRNRP